MRRLCEDIALQVEGFSHVRMDEVAVTFAQARVASDVDALSFSVLVDQPR